MVLCVASTLLTLQNSFQRAPSAPSGGKGLSGGYTALAGRLQPADSGQSGRAVAPQAVGIQCPSVGIDEWAFINRGDGVATRTPPPHSSPCRSTRTSNLWTSSKARGPVAPSLLRRGLSHQPGQWPPAPGRASCLSPLCLSPRPAGTPRPPSAAEVPSRLRMPPSPMGESYPVTAHRVTCRVCVWPRGGSSHQVGFAAFPEASRLPLEIDMRASVSGVWP